MEIIFSVVNFLRFLAVANFANINSNESSCPVGYIYQCSDYEILDYFSIHVPLFHL